ncbi:MAG: LysM peptidoglycan-binding domain-containing protein [Clostridia bacterium]|nr:LysM peptidoglycan-binding domain-containing protein [Clostridia bacterium]
MRSDCVLAGESLNELAARLRVPACMLMRANGLFSPAWLLPGREIIVPEGECGGSFPCPREAFYRMARPREAGDRLLPLSWGGGLVFLRLPVISTEAK